MNLTPSEQIRVWAARRGMSLADIARGLGITPQGLNGMMRRDNFTYKQLKAIGALLDCDINIELVPRTPSQDDNEI